METYTLKTYVSNTLGHGICNNLSRAVTFPVATDDASFLAKEAIALVKAMKTNVTDLRGVSKTCIYSVNPYIQERSVCLGLDISLF